MKNLDSIFSKRFGGSVNIRGISYQIRYALLKSFELFDGIIESITLEGIEDVDLKHVSLDKSTFIQVKSSDKEWKWYQIQDPLINFIEVFKIKSDVNFVLVLNKPYKKDLEKLSRYKLLNSKDKKEIETKFVKLCKKVLSDPEEILLSFLDKLTITYLTDDQLNINLQQKITEKLDIQTNAANIYLFLLVSNFLDWAKQRKSVTKTDILNVVEIAKEALAVEEKFHAIGRGLINKISWSAKGIVNDFYEGKNAKPSHISSNADYKRIKWLKIINEAVLVNKLCLIKGSSGQGKSTLLYRYAFDYWLRENVYKLNALKSIEHVELILQFLKHKSQLGLPILVLIDNINSEVQYWSELVEASSGFEIYFLASVRKEDWFRYGKENLKYEVIEPFLDLEEAREIYKLLRYYGKVNKTIESPEIAFEKIGDCKLLIEYIYLITHGEMLEDRLRDQIRYISSNNEDPVKIVILRKVSLANKFNSPLLMDQLIKSIDFNNDPQMVIESLEGEYLKIENNLIGGVHWVRTEHLYRILNNNYFNPSHIALDILSAIPKDNLKIFISGLLFDPNIDKTIFIEGLVTKSRGLNIDTIVSIIEGFYIGGEKNFYFKNKKVFDAASKIITDGPWFLTLGLLLVNSKNNTLDELIGILGPEKGANFVKLKELFNKIVYVERGKDFCSKFLKYIISDIDPDKFSDDYLSIAKFLDWTCFSEMELPLKDEYLKIVLDYLNNFSNISTNDFILLAQSLFRIDKNLFLNWYNHNLKHIKNYLKFISKSVILEIKKDNLSFKFIPKYQKGFGFHEQTIERVNLFQDVLPFITSFTSKGLYYFPDTMKPSFDETVKEIKNKTFNFKLDIERNKEFLNVVMGNYHIDSFYEYQNYLYLLRTDVLTFFNEFIVILIKAIKKIQYKNLSSFENGKLLQRIIDSIKLFPKLPPQTNETIKNEIEKIINQWSISIKSFIFQIDSYINNTTQVHDLNLALVNLRNAVEKLPNLQNATIELCKISPDYFSLNEFANDELSVYENLYDLIELKFKMNPQEKINNPLEYMRKQKSIELKRKLNLIQDQFMDNLTDYTLSNTIVHKESLSYYSIIFEVCNISMLDIKLTELIIKLYPIKKVVDFFFLIPTSNQRKLIDGHFNISSNTIEKIKSGEMVEWEFLMPSNFQNDLIQGLPNILDPIKQIDSKILLEDMIFKLQCLENYKKLIFDYLNPNDKYDKILIENYKDDMKEILAESLKITKEGIGNSNDDRITEVFEEINNIYINFDLVKTDFPKLILNINNILNVN